MIFVDTGYLLALFNPDDAHYERALRWSEFIDQPSITTEYVFLEAVNAYSARHFRRRAVQIIQFLSHGDEIMVLPIDSQTCAMGVRAFETRLDKSWSLTDCISFNVMAERGITQALAHDHHFEQAGFEALLRRDP